VLRMSKLDNWKWNDSWNGSIFPEKLELPIKENIQKPDVAKPEAVKPEVVKPKNESFSYQEALQQSGETGKPVLVFFAADWCEYCTKMKIQTLPQEEVKNKLKNYIVTYVNVDKDSILSKKFGIKVLPSYVVTNYKEEKIKLGKGFMEANSFSNWLNDSKLLNQPKKDN
jgi:thiol:disulfide interchange protein